MCPPSNTPLRPHSQASPGLSPEYLPTDSISIAAYDYAVKHLDPVILNHSIRVFLYAQAIGTREDSIWFKQPHLHLLFTACILHDIGTTSAHDGSLRFEVEGADAAVKLLKQFTGVSKEDAHEVWTAIAIHTSPHIAERISPLARLVRLAVIIDFKNAEASKLTSEDEIAMFEERCPRLGIEKVLGDMVVEQAVRRPEKAPAASWPGVLLRAKGEFPEWDGVNKAF